MSGPGFGSLFMATSVAGAALGCYLISLNVASERAKLENVESQIVRAERDIRLLQTELGTRGRLDQLERWNANFIRLSAPTADQILEGGFQLAAMVRPPERKAIDAPMVYAAAPAEERAPVLGGDADVPSPTPKKPASETPPSRPDQMMHVASYEVPVRAAPPKPVAPKTDVPKTATKKASSTAKLASSGDPLAPLPGASGAAKGHPAAEPKGTPARNRKDSGTQQ